MRHTLSKLDALKRVRRLNELAKSRVDAHAREHAYTITKLTKQEKDEYLFTEKLLKLVLLYKIVCVS